jgi:hypothetical protein
MRLDSAVYAFVDDFVDEGVPHVAQRLAAQGFSAVSLAAVYHAARDLLPHNPRRVVAHRGEGVHYFPPAATLYRAAVQPLAATRAALPEVAAAVGAAGLSWHAWTVYLHNGRLASARPDCAVTNAFGDVYETDLCPSSSEAADYAAALTADVARLRPALIAAESLHHAGFAHGAHHERAFVPVSPIADFLLSLCFCASCVSRAGARVDVEQLAAGVRGVVRDELRSPTASPHGLDRDALAQRCGSQLPAYLAVRESTVTELVARCASLAREHGVRFGFIDQAGALKGYASGEPTGPSSCADAWRLGVEPRAVAGVVDAYIALAYAKSPDRVALDVRDYVSSLGGTPLRCVLRHGSPDLVDAGDLREKVHAARENGADAADFYHYGLMSLSGLDAAAAAIGS